MRILPFLLPLAACNAGGVVVVKDSTGNDPWGDADTDSDSDADSDADADSDTDADSDADSDSDADVDAPPDEVVDCNGSGDFTTIQAAINASVSGDRIGLMACEYHETIDYLGKSIEVYGIEGSAKTEIDGDYAGTVVNIETGEGGWTRLAGVTISDGYDPADGAAIEIEYAVAELEDVVIDGSGDGMWQIRSSNGWVDATDVTIKNSSIVAEGGAITVDGGSFTGLRITADCGAGTVAFKDHNAVILTDSSFTCAGGYGIQNYHGELYLKRVRAEGGITGLYTYDEAGTEEEPDSPTERVTAYNSVFAGGSKGIDILYERLELYNSVVWGADAALAMTLCNASSLAMNSVFMNSACGISGDQGFSSTYSAFYNNTADGCGVTVSPAVTTDPLFTAFPSDLTLAAGSPLKDAGSNGAAYKDVDGSRNDIGITGGPWSP